MKDFKDIILVTVSNWQVASGQYCSIVYICHGREVNIRAVFLVCYSAVVDIDCDSVEGRHWLWFSWMLKLANIQLG